MIPKNDINDAPEAVRLHYLPAEANGLPLHASTVD
jgi:hypothetical protein